MRREWIGRILAVHFLFVFTIFDITIVENILHKYGAWETIDLGFTVYHVATFLFLVPAIIISTSLALHSWRLLAYSIVYIYLGWLDILYYIFQGRTLPTRYEWLFYLGKPTRDQLVVLASLSLLLMIIIDIIASNLRYKDKQNESSLYS